MDIEVPNEKLVVAVSGGVDSVVLLDLLAKAGADIVVAHFDHGMRPDSADDARFVAGLAEKYRVQFAGASSAEKLKSEAAARDARYAFLRQVQRDAEAARIVTAHHQDDLLETAVLNLLRGTGRQGLSSLKSDGSIWRPLLHVTKTELTNYALANQLPWHEDATNQDVRLRRNYVRHELLPRLATKDPVFRDKLLTAVQSAGEQNSQINELLAELTEELMTPTGMVRQKFIGLPHSLSREIMLRYLRSHDALDMGRPAIERLVVVGKTARPGTSHDVCHHLVLLVTPQQLQVVDRRQ